MLLLADTKRLDEIPVTLDVLLLQVVEQSAPLADEHQQTAARMMILHVHPEMLRKVRNPL